MLLDRSGQGKGMPPQSPSSFDDIAAVHWDYMVTHSGSFFSVSADLQAKIPSDGRPGGSEHPGHHQWEEEQNPGVLSVLVEDQDLQE